MKIEYNISEEQKAFLLFKGLAPASTLIFYLFSLLRFKISLVGRRHTRFLHEKEKMRILRSEDESLKMRLNKGKTEF